jgi:WD40 repeat protein
MKRECFFIAVYGHKKIYIYDFHNKETTRTLEFSEEETIQAITMVNSHELVVAQDGSLILYNTITNTRIREAKIGFTVTGMCTAGDNVIFYGAQFGVWNTKTGECQLQENAWQVVEMWPVGENRFLMSYINNPFELWSISPLYCISSHKTAARVLSADMWRQKIIFHMSSCIYLIDPDTLERTEYMKTPHVKESVYTKVIDDKVLLVTYSYQDYESETAVSIYNLITRQIHESKAFLPESTTYKPFAKKDSLVVYCEPKDGGIQVYDIHNKSILRTIKEAEYQPENVDVAVW